MQCNGIWTTIDTTHSSYLGDSIRLDMDTCRIKDEHSTHNIGMVLAYTYKYYGITIH